MRGAWRWWPLLALACGAVQAADAPAAAPLGLVEVWQAAVRHDREFAAAAAAYQAGQARGEQAKALWRPSVLLTATAGRAGHETATSGAQFSAPGFGQATGVGFNTSVNNGNSTQWAVTARQPLISGERSAQSGQLSTAADMAEQQWQGAQQALKLRTAERYFEVALAATRLQVLQQQAQAVGRSAQEAQDRYQLGDAPVTDTHEAAARLAALQAQVLAAQSDVQLKQAALASMSGLPAATLQVPAPVSDVSLPPLAALEQWLADASTRNPGVRLQTLQVRMAEQESAKYGALSAPSLDLVAQAGRERLSGSGDYGAASNSASQRMLGVQFSLPLYTGGWRSARRDESRALQDQASAQAEQARLEVLQQTRAAWLGLSVGSSRVQALSTARKASAERLQATRLGLQVGHRTTLDLLNATNDAAQADLDLAQARIELLLNRLRLSALAGQLDDPEFQTMAHSWRLALEP